MVRRTLSGGGETRSTTFEHFINVWVVELLSEARCILPTLIRKNPTNSVVKDGIFAIADIL